jgi:hypothetical protein
MAITPESNLFTTRVDRARTIVDQNEIVPRSIHLGESDHVAFTITVPPALFNGILIFGEASLATPSWIWHTT